MRLKYLFENVIASDYRMLRGKTIECISSIGLAVGKDKVCVYDLFILILFLLLVY